jgi:type II secretory pathway component PulF
VTVTYQALDGAGRRVSGDVEARDEAEAAATLRQRGLFPVELRVGRGAKASAPSAPRAWGIVSSADRVLFLQQIALMLRTGLTLLRTLETVTQQGSKPALRAAAQRLSNCVRSGQPLSDALEEEGALFPPLVAQLVRTAEATGELGRAFSAAAEHLERRATLKFQVLSALTYPAVVMLVAGGVFWFLALKIVPKLARFVAGRGGTLPATTQALLDVSAFLRTYGGPLALGAAALAACVLSAYRTRGGRRALDRGALAVPVLGGVLEAAALGHLTRTLSLLLSSGLPLLQALEVLRHTMGNQTYVDGLEAAAEEVVRGASLADALDQPGVSPLTRQVVATGEEAGSLDVALDELARYYEQRLSQRLTTMARLVEPAILLVVGGMVGFVYLSFFQAVFQLAAR